jgi:hypothetical protein
MLPEMGKKCLKERGRGEKRERKRKAHQGDYK